MTYCVNPECLYPENPDSNKFCNACGYELWLKQRYRPISKMGQGGFGRTFLAADEDIPSKPHCVVKQLDLRSFNPNSKDKAIALFQQEAVRLDELGKHPQIPALLAYFEQQQHLYVVQELIEGQTLAQEHYQQGAFNEDQIWHLLQDLTPVLQFIHHRQVIHRDIKPANLMRRTSDRKLILIDFGIAKRLTALNSQQTGTIVGSPEYVSPEQLKGKPSPASDLYSLGVTCLYLLTQVPSPFSMYNTVTQKWEWRDFVLPENRVSDRLGRILDKLTQNSLTLRYQSADELWLAVSPKIIPQKTLQPASPPPKSALQPLINSLEFAKTWLGMPTQVVSGDLLNSEVGIDYTKLRNYLALGKLQAADEETWRILSKLVNKGERGYLLSQDIERIPCEDLATLNNLWIKYSSARFGFTIQAQIYQDVGEDYGSFCDRLGWQVHHSQSQIQYSYRSPIGHLPSQIWAGGTQRWRHIKSLTEKLTACGLF